MRGWQSNLKVSAVHTCTLNANPTPQCTCIFDSLCVCVRVCVAKNAMRAQVRTQEHSPVLE